MNYFGGRFLADKTAMLNELSVKRPVASIMCFLKMSMHDALGMFDFDKHSYFRTKTRFKRVSCFHVFPRIL